MTKEECEALLRAMGVSLLVVDQPFLPDSPRFKQPYYRVRAYLRGRYRLALCNVRYPASEAIDYEDFLIRVIEITKTMRREDFD